MIPRRWRPWLGSLALAALLVALVAFEAIRTLPERRAVRAYTELIAAANRQDVGAARRLCSARYLRTHELRPAPEGGLVDLPRRIHPNFRAWRHGRDVWFCPTNRGRYRPVFRFVQEGGAWRYDGPIGTLGQGDAFVPVMD